MSTSIVTSRNSKRASAGPNRLPLGGGTTASRLPAKLQIVGQAVAPFINGQSALATAVRWQGRIPVISGPWPTSEYRAPVRGWYMNNVLARTNLPKDYTVSLALEVLQGTMVTASAPILFDGVQSKVVVAGSDDFNSDDWCAVNGPIAAGAHGWLRYDVTVETAGMLSVSGFLANFPVSALAGFNAWFATNGAATGNVNGVGAMPSTGGTIASGGLAPLCLAGMLGKYDYQRTSMLIIGNSRDAGSASMQIACIDMGIPVVNFGYAGSTAVQWGAFTPAMLATAAYCSDVFIGDCINDLQGGTSVAVIQAAYVSLIGKLKAINPALRIWGKKCLPQSDSLDGYVTTVNQTPKSWSLPPSSQRDQYNAWLDTLVGPSLYGVLDPCVGIESGGSGASGKWVPFSTTDGLHQVAANNPSEAVLFRQQFLAQGGIPNTGVY